MEPVRENEIQNSDKYKTYVDMLRGSQDVLNKWKFLFLAHEIHEKGEKVIGMSFFGFIQYFKIV